MVFCIYVLYSRQWQSFGYHFLFAFLKILKDSLKKISKDFRQLSPIFQDLEKNSLQSCHVVIIYYLLVLYLMLTFLNFTSQLMSTKANWLS